MVRRRSEKGFRRITWDTALDLIADRVRATSPQRLAFYLTSRGMSNEVYYVAQKAARFMGTNNIDNSSRICHAPSTYAMKQTLGVSASTCSWQLIGTDLSCHYSDIANTTRDDEGHYYAKQQGTRVAINPFANRGWACGAFQPESCLERSWPTISSDSHRWHIAFINGVLKHLIENNWLDDGFIEGFDWLRGTGFWPGSQSWELLESARASCEGCWVRTPLRRREDASSSGA
jgi:hypothetical protein